MIRVLIGLILIIIVAFIGYYGFLLIRSHTVIPANFFTALTSSGALPTVSPTSTTGTQNPAPTTPAQTQPGQPATATAALGQTIVVNGLSITPLAIVEDSRCPIDVQCIQAGQLSIQVRLDAGGASAQPTLTFGQSIGVAGNTLTFFAVAPAKTSKTPLAPSDYRFSFSVAPAPKQ